MAVTPKKFRPVSEAAASHSLGLNVSRALRDLYPANTAKRVANDIGAEERTVRNWLEGNAPQSAWLFKLFTFYGARFAGFVLAPCGDWATRLRLEAELDLRITEAEQMLDQLKRHQAARRARKS